MRTMKSTEIEMRAKIAEATEATPGISYRTLQERFGTSSRVVADALRQPSSYWRKLLGQKSGARVDRWEYLAVAVKEVEQGVLATQLEGEATWTQRDEDTLHDVCNAFGNEGWRLVSVHRTVAGAFGTFSGTYELVFTRELLVYDPIFS